MDELQKHINEEVHGDIDQLYKHAQIANEEMGVIKNDIKWIKDWVKTIDAKLWAIIALMVGIAIKVLFYGN